MFFLKQREIQRNFSHFAHLGKVKTQIFCALRNFRSKLDIVARLARKNPGRKLNFQRRVGERNRICGQNIDGR